MDRLNDAAVPDRLPLATAGLPGIGGVLKATPEDFVVEEIPAYEPSGEGTFLYLRVEKRDLSAEQLVKAVARATGVSTAEVGQAGLKDKRAITRQWLSVPASVEPLLPRIDGPSIRVLDVRRHSNKLRTGHLRGNVFHVTIREVTEDALPRAQAIAALLREGGVPNYFGEQRFGRDSSTGLAGLALLRGERTQQTRVVAFDRFRKRLALSAAQSTLYNAYLALRIERHGLTTVLDGDLLAKRDTGGVFLSEERELDQGRLLAGELVHTGPIYGRKTRLPAGEALLLEREVLAMGELPDDAFERFGKLTMGTRRHNVVFPEALAVEPVEGGLRVSFALPKGAYATVLLRELRKAAAPEAPDGDAEAELLEGEE